MNAFTKIKLSKESIELVAKIKSDQINTLEKVRLSRRLNEIIIKLGGQIKPEEKTKTADDQELSDNTNDENYRWKDTAIIAGARKHMSALFATAKKEGRNVTNTEIDWDELNQDPRIAEALITKTNVFGVVDWNALREAGMPSNVAYLIKRVYTAVDKAPLVPMNAESMRNYTTAITTLRQKLEACRTYEDVRDAIIEINKYLVRPRYLKQYYEDSSIANSYKPLEIYETRVFTELGERFTSWIWKSGNKALHECKTNRNPSTRKESKGATWTWLDGEPKVEGEDGKPTKPKKTRFQLEYASSTERIGGKEVDLKSSKQLEEMFGLRGIQSGNWVLKDKNSAEFHMKSAAEAMLDMSDVLGIDAKYLGLDGNLALAFGARGKGGALAHYEPFSKVINITKMKGGGALGHEYFHAMDNLIKDLSVGEAGSSSFYATRDYAQIPDLELSNAFKNLNEALNTRKDVLTYKTPYVDLNEELSERRKTFMVNSADNFARKLGVGYSDVLHSMPIPEISELVESLYKEKQKGSNLSIRGLIEREYGEYLILRHYAVGDVQIEDGGVVAPMAGAVSRSRFYASSLALDEHKDGKYWSKEYEMAARAFSSYLQDKLEEKERRNDYLAYGTKTKDGQGTLGNPDGVERKNINDAFDHIFELIRKKQIFEKSSQNKALLDSIFGTNLQTDEITFEELEEENLLGEEAPIFEPLESTETVIQVHDIVAQTAATSTLNSDQPTQEQLIANEYQTAEIQIAGIDIVIENPVGSIRKGTDPDGHEWQTEMTAHYGYIKNTIGADGDEIDIFIAPGTSPDFDGRVFVIKQINQEGEFDEHKVVLGVTSKAQVINLYQAHYDEHFNGMGAIIELSLDDFKECIYGEKSLYDYD